LFVYLTQSGPFRLPLINIDKLLDLGRLALFFQPALKRSAL
jgi:hypothetical protein